MDTHIFNLLSIIPAFLLAFTVHEYAHAAVAYFLGDDTAAKAGRLTLNPIAHIDPFGLIFLILFRIGWGKPVPMNIHNFKYPRIYGLLAAFAGPASNILMAMTMLVVFKLAVVYGIYILGTASLTIAYMNVMLGVFNMIPIPPLDGGHIITLFIPEHWYRTYPWINFVFLILVIAVISVPMSQHFIVNSIQTVFTVLYSLIVGN